MQIPKNPLFRGIDHRVDPDRRTVRQDMAALRAEYDAGLHAFTRLLDIVNECFVPFGARGGSGAVTRSKLTSWWQNRAIPPTHQKDILARRICIDSLRSILVDRPWNVRQAIYGLFFRLLG